MGFNMNIFRVLGDISHTSSKLILIWSVHHNRSAEGVSLLTQLLYILVFGTRYLDLFWVPPSWSYWNFVLKLFYIGSSGYIVFLMMRVYTRTREREAAWRLAMWSLGGSLTASPLVLWFFWALGFQKFTFTEVLYTFSIILESVCVLPQLLLLRQTSVPTVIDSFYLVTLGSYRMFYILNWIVRGIGEKHFDPISCIFGIVQTLLYVDFAWVYWTRQRIKLRGGGVVDGDDLSKSFLVRRFIGRKSTSNDDEDVSEEDAALAGQESGTVRPAAPRGGRSWGARGISVRADDTLDEQDSGGRDGQMADPSHFEDEENVEAPPPPAKDDRFRARSPQQREEEAVANSAEEWQENAGGGK